MTWTTPAGILGSAVTALALMSTSASAATCLGICGTLGPDGSVIASPEGGTYSFVTTAGGVNGAGQIPGVGGTNGSSFTSDTFAATAGQALKFFFNYVTSDGSEFADYAFAELIDSVGNNVAYLFTGRTQPDGDISPGFGLPVNAATLTPATSAIIDQAPIWSVLGGSSGGCFDGLGQGCGITGWIESNYTIVADGTYALRFGVTNFTDGDFQSGLAYDGATIGGEVIIPDPGVSPVPVPASALLLGSALVGLAGLRRRKVA